MPKGRKSSQSRKKSSGVEQFFNQIGKGRGRSKGKKKSTENEGVMEGM